MNIRTKKELVLLAISNNPDAADDDAILQSECNSIELADRGIHLLPQQIYEILKYTSRAETLTRRRRELFNEGKIQYSAKASDRRMKAFNSEREVHSSYKVLPW